MAPEIKEGCHIVLKFAHKDCVFYSYVDKHKAKKENDLKSSANCLGERKARGRRKQVTWTSVRGVIQTVPQNFFTATHIQNYIAVKSKIRSARSFLDQLVMSYRPGERTSSCLQWFCFNFPDFHSTSVFQLR